MEKIVLDTSVLLSISELKIDLFEEIRKAADFNYEIFVVDGTLEELEKLINGPSLSKRQAARFGLKLIKAKSVKVLETDGKGSVDDRLVDLDGVIIATVDRDLKRRLRDKGTRILTIRQKKYVLLE